MAVSDLNSRARATSLIQQKEAGVLQRIRQPGVAAVIWQRDPGPGFLDWVSGLPATALPEFRSLVAVSALESCVHAACNLAGTPAGPHRSELAADIAMLGRLMGETMGTSLLHVRLAAVSGDACRRFHTDNMTARMLCTYRGAGTQIARPGEEDTPVSAPTGSVVLLRGSRWPGAEETGLLHRSPPIAGTGETRLIVVIDPAADHDPEHHHP